MKKMFIVSIMIAAALIVAGCGGNNDRITGDATAPGQLDSFAQCLTENDVKMYGTDWCSYCNLQKDTFGNSFAYVDFVDCDMDRSACTDAGIQGFPTWVINGQSYPGLQSIERLSQLSGCSL